MGKVPDDVVTCLLNARTTQLTAPFGMAVNVDLVEVFRACGDEVRMKILEALSIQPLCVQVIKEIVGEIQDSKLSYHLMVLKRSRLIRGERRGSWIIYSLTDLGRTVVDFAHEVEMRMDRSGEI